MEIRYVAASVLRKYNISYAGEQSAFQKGMVDGFTLALPETPIKFESR